MWSRAKSFFYGVWWPREKKVSVHCLRPWFVTLMWGPIKRNKGIPLTTSFTTRERCGYHAAVHTFPFLTAFFFFFFLCSLLRDLRPYMSRCTRDHSRWVLLRRRVSRLLRVIMALRPHWEEWRRGSFQIRPQAAPRHSRQRTRARQKVGFNLVSIVSRHSCILASTSLFSCFLDGLSYVTPVSLRCLGIC